MPRGSATSREVVARPLVTYALVALNIAAFVLVEGAGTPQALARAVCDFGLIPGELTGALPPGTRFPMGDGLVCLTDPGRQLGNVLTSMFLHGSWMHLLGNMWFLWLFGNNIEDSMGRARFVVFYLACGVAAALVQVVVNPRSVVPMVGASGAISGVMGAYLVLYPHVRVYTLLPIGFFTVALPAWTMLLCSSAGSSVRARPRPVASLVARPEDVRAHREGDWQPRRVSGRW